MSRHPTGADMTPPIENVATWLVDSSVVTIIDITLPPRDPNDDDNEDDEDDERHDEDDEDDENDEDDEDDEPAVVREPDPDEQRRIRPIFRRRASRRRVATLSAVPAKEAAMRTLELSEEETQLIEILREWDGDDAYQLIIERRDGAWDLSMKELGTSRGARGTGATFDAAWDNMDPLWA